MHMFNWFSPLYGGKNSLSLNFRVAEIKSVFIRSVLPTINMSINLDFSIENHYPF